MIKISPRACFTFSLASVLAALVITLAAVGDKFTSSQYVVKGIQNIDGRNHGILQPTFAPLVIITPGEGELGFPALTRGDILRCEQVVKTREVTLADKSLMRFNAIFLRCHGRDYRIEGFYVVPGDVHLKEEKE